MGKPDFSDEFKRDAVAQITERGYPAAEVSERLGVSQHSLYAWKRQLAKVVSAQWFLCLAEEPAEPTGSRRCSADGTDPAGLERQRQDLWLPQAAR